jgi:SPP1 gp7 family putative phage head morphogenesis protein
MAKQQKPFVYWLQAMGLSLNRIKSRIRRKSPVFVLPRTVENYYARQLKILVGEWRQLYLQMIDPQLESLAQQAYMLKPPESVGVKTDAWPDDLDALIAGYGEALNKTLEPINKLTSDIAYDVSDLNLKQWKRATSKILGVNVFASEPWLLDQLESFAKQNTNLITKLGNTTQSEVKRIIEDGLQRGRRVENIRKEIVGFTSVRGQTISYRTKTGKKVSWFQTAGQRAELIARDQIAKLNGQLTQLRQNEIGIDRYEWKDVDDAKVRTSHAVMDGLLCKWENATVYSDDGGKTWKKRSGIGGVEQHPGQDYQCRCFALADFSSIL